jgi:Rps23 Pro-64 3,4-dihydroxylase Tpa1-like proline 4-hydroxylase
MILEIEKKIKINNFEKSFNDFKNQPFDHCVVDDFFHLDFAETLESEFLPYESDKWNFYNNQIEHKKTCNMWDIFPKNTYSLFCYLNSQKFVKKISKLVNKKLYPDIGLNGGGWHIHGTGGNLNPHLDYSIHPKLSLQRKLNIIIYLSSDIKEEHGGHLGLYDHKKDSEKAPILKKEIQPKFNRAVIFDTTQNSWHGMSRKLNIPENIYRKSLAIYYLCDPPELVDMRGKALFAPREEQLNDESVKNLIKVRSNIKTAESVYKKE